MKTIIIDNVEYGLVPKQASIKSELDALKEKYATGNYICISGETRNQKTIWVIVSDISQFTFGNFKLIHKKHKDILDAYLADNNVEIEERISGSSHWHQLVCDWLEAYHPSNHEYRLKPQVQYPIFKRNGVGEVFRFEPYSITGSCVFGDSYNMVGTWYDNKNYKIIQYDIEQGLYHLQPVFCIHPDDRHIIISFYNKSDSFFKECGMLESITREQLKTMPFIWDLYKKVLKENNV